MSNILNYRMSNNMIGRLVLSSRNLYKIHSTNEKLVSARKCYILSENTSDLLVQTNKEFNPKDIYVKLNNQINTSTISQTSPIYQIDQILGTIGDLQDDLNIFHYLYTKDWMSNFKYKKLWEDIGFDPTYDYLIENRINYQNQVITIDPLGSIDLDDGFSFRSDESNYYLDIHIADPTSYFNFSNPLMIKIFIEFINRINTCYIPNSKGSNQPIHLLPEQIIKYISLLETTREIPTRRAITFLFIINKKTNEISYQVQYTLLSNIINKTYEQFDLEINKNIIDKQELINLVNCFIKNMGLRYRSIEFDEDISHKMIEIFMIWVNCYAGNFMLKNQAHKLIVRSQDKKDLPEDFEKIPDYCINFLAYSANYKIILNNESEEHYSLNVSNYCHVSSPMRRVVDMLNHLLINKHGKNDFDIDQFILNHVNIDKINNKIKIQRKISNAYELVKILKTNKTFKACVMDLKFKDDITYGLLVVCTKILIDGIETELKKMVNVEIPKTFGIIHRFQELDIELHYNSINYKNNKFPFSIKIL